MRAPSRMIFHLPPASTSVRSTTVEGSPVSSPPSMTRSAEEAICSSTSSTRAGGARRCGWRWSGRPVRRRRSSGPSIRRMPEPLGRVAVGERIAAFGVVDDQRHRPGQQRRQHRADDRRDAVDDLAHRLVGEVHDRRGLAGLAVLEAVDALDRLAVGGIAGESVETVGREHGDAAVGDRPLEGAGGRRRRRRPRSRPARSLANHDPLDRRQIRTRLYAAEARVGGELGDGGAWPAPTSSAIARARGRVASSARIASSPSSPASRASRGSNSRISGCSPAHSPAAT